MKIAYLTIGTAFMVGTAFSPALWLGEIEQKTQDGVNIQTKSNNKPVVTIRMAQVENFNTSRSNVSSATLTVDEECAKDNKKKDKNCAPSKRMDEANKKPAPAGPVILVEDHNSARSNVSSATFTGEDGAEKNRRTAQMFRREY